MQYAFDNVQHYLNIARKGFVDHLICFDHFLLPERRLHVTVQIAEGTHVEILAVTLSVGSQDLSL